MSKTAQQMAALEGANKLRYAAWALRQDLAAGRVRFEDALDAPEAQCARLYDLLLATPRVGELTMRRIVNRVGRDTGAKYALGLKRLRELTPAQREALLLAVCGPKAEASS